MSEILHELCDNDFVYVRDTKKERPHHIFAHKLLLHENK